jgi:hypothetical protein
VIVAVNARSCETGTGCKPGSVIVTLQPLLCPQLEDLEVEQLSGTVASGKLCRWPLRIISPVCEKPALQRVGAEPGHV